MINTINSYKYINSATTTQVVTGACTLVGITVNTTSTGTIGIIDGTTGVVPTVGQLKASVAEGNYIYNVSLGTGLRINTGGASDITVEYRVH